MNGDFPPVGYETWRALVERDLKGAPFEKRLVTQTYEGVPVQPLYTREHWPSASSTGEEPRRRADSSQWTIVQRYDHPSVEQSARELARDVERGVQGVWLAIADEGVRHRPRGALIDTVADLENVLGNVTPSGPIVLDAGAAFLGAAASLIGLLRKRGKELRDVRAVFGADPIGTLVERGEVRVPLARQLQDLAELATFTSERLPNSKSVYVSTAPYSDRGATAVQELAAAVATGLAYLHALEQGGLSPAQAAPQIVFGFSVGCDQFMEIAKLRAARVLWQRVLEACQLPSEQQIATIHAVTARRVLTQRDPWVNQLRGTIGCFSSVVGGADWVTVLPFDSAITQPDSLSLRVARNTQIILQEESHLGFVSDPARGSWYVETLTEQLASAAWELMQQIQSRGGMIASLRDGWFLEAVSRVRVERSKNLARRKDAITGVSEFPNVRESALEAHEYPLEAAWEQLTARRQRLDTDPKLTASRERLAGAARGERVALAVEHLVQGGSISQVTALGSDTSEAIPTPPVFRFAEGYEKLRDRSDAFLAKTGRRPRVFLANMGPIADHTARATFTRNFFEAGGFEVVTNDGFNDAAAAAAAYSASGASVAVICSSDTLYQSFVSTVAPALKSAGARELVLAGRPGEFEQQYRSAGVDRFIFIGCDVLQTLADVLRVEGIEQ